MNVLEFTKKAKNFDKKMLDYYNQLEKTIEKWVEITDDRYPKLKIGKISNHGRYEKPNGEIFDFSNQHERYYRISIRNGKSTVHYSVHRLVAKYFCPISKDLIDKGYTFETLVTNHKNGIKHLNAAFNLELIPSSENTNHAWETGLCESIQGENNHMSTISNTQAIHICELLSKGYSVKETSKKTGVREKIVSHIKYRESWKSISKNYNFRSNKKCTK